MTRQRGITTSTRLLLAGLAAAVLAQRPASAAELSLVGQLPSLDVHGFISQGFLLTSANDYLAESSRGSFEFSEVGLNFTLPATNRLTLGVQIFSRKLGPLGDYRATFDWYYLDYHWKDWLGVRAGRVKLPFGLYNDVSDIDAARTGGPLSPSVYSPPKPGLPLAPTRGGAFGNTRVGGGGGLEFKGYAGPI